jgi:hypothetical protein
VNLQLKLKIKRRHFTSLNMERSREYFWQAFEGFYNLIPIIRSANEMIRNFRRKSTNDSSTCYHCTVGVCRVSVLMLCTSQFKIFIDDFYNIKS